VLDVSSTISHCNMLAFSRLTSVMLLGMYGIYLWFQLKTHTHLFEDEDGPLSRPPFTPAVPRPVRHA
jgi:Ca2+/H+ antiporter